MTCRRTYGGELRPERFGSENGGGIKTALSLVFLNPAGPGTGLENIRKGSNYELSDNHEQA